MGLSPGGDESGIYVLGIMFLCAVLGVLIIIYGGTKELAAKLIKERPGIFKKFGLRGTQLLLIIIAILLFIIYQYFFGHGAVIHWEY